MFIFSLSFEVLSILSNALLIRLSIIDSMSAVPSMISSASLPMAPKLILSIVCGPARGVNSARRKYNLVQRRIVCSINFESMMV